MDNCVPAKWYWSSSNIFEKYYFTECRFNNQICTEEIFLSLTSYYCISGRRWTKYCVNLSVYITKNLKQEDECVVYDTTMRFLDPNFEPQPSYKISKLWRISVWKTITWMILNFIFSVKDILCQCTSFLVF